MNKKLNLTLVLILCGALFIPCFIPCARMRAYAQEAVPYLLKFPPGTEGLIPPGAQHLLGNWYRAILSPYDVQALSAYGVHAEQDVIISVNAQPNDPYYWNPAVTSRFGLQRQWWLDKILAPDAWDYATGSGIKIAILDSGYSYGHPDLPAPVAGWDFIENDGIPQDENGHGTHVAGIIGATANNSTGIAGVAPGASLVVYRILDAKGDGNVSSVMTAVQRAITDSVQIINISAGTTVYNDALRDAINAARSAGITTICSAGNTGSNINFYPAVDCDLAVAATTSGDLKASFSAYGQWWVDVAAPGEAVLSTMPITHTWMITKSGYYQGYDALNGTSMSAPQVAGIVALALQAGRCNGPDSCKRLICGTADKVPGTGTYWACGRVNAAAVLLQQPQPTPTPWLPAPTPTPWSNTPTPTPLPTPTPTPFVWPTPAVLPPWGITMSLPVLPTPIYDPEGNPVVGYSAAFMQQKAGVDGILGGVVGALQQANAALDDLQDYVGDSALGAEALGVISGSLSLQASEVRGQSVDLLRASGEDALHAQVAVLSSLSEDLPNLQEAAALVGVAAAQPIAYLRGWGRLMASADENPRGQVFLFISSIIGAILAILVFLGLFVVIRYIFLPIASALWNLLRDIWEAIPFIG